MKKRRGENARRIADDTGLNSIEEKQTTWGMVRDSRERGEGTRVRDRGKIKKKNNRLACRSISGESSQVSQNQMLMLRCSSTFAGNLFKFLLIKAGLRLGKPHASIKSPREPTSVAQFPTLFRLLVLAKEQAPPEVTQNCSF